MSYVFEGLLLPADREAVQNGIDASARGEFDLLSAAEAGMLLRRRGRVRFSDTVDTLATRLSLQFGRSLVIRYDDRIGHRSAAIYSSGHLDRSFGPSDEIYVLLDDDGYPNLEGPRYTIQELGSIPEGQEYECVINAIQRGLASFGLLTWDQLRTAFAREPGK